MISLGGLFFSCVCFIPPVDWSGFFRILSGSEAVCPHSFHLGFVQQCAISDPMRKRTLLGSLTAFWGVVVPSEVCF